jgi:hypothetical protein
MSFYDYSFHHDPANNMTDIDLQLHSSNPGSGEPLV